MTETTDFAADRIDLSQVEYVELASRSRIKVRSAQLVNLAVEADGGTLCWEDRVLKLETTSGKECYVPLRHIVRFDLSED